MLSPPKRPAGTGAVAFRSVFAFVVLQTCNKPHSAISRTVASDSGASRPLRQLGRLIWRLRANHWRGIANPAQSLSISQGIAGNEHGRPWLRDPTALTSQTTGARDASLFPYPNGTVR